MKYIEVKIETVDDLHDEVILTLQEMGIETIQEESLELVKELNRPEIAWDYVDSEIIGLEENRLNISFYIAEVDNPEKVVEDIQIISRERGWGTVLISEVKDEDWANEWKKYYKPLAVGKHLWIVPSWEKFTPQTEDIEIRLDPGMAFGSGTHETTYLCMEKLEKYITKGDRVFDIGCGSGILSVVSARLGAKEVVGVDIDPVAITASRENAKIKSRRRKLYFLFLGNLLDVVEGKAELIVSNIIAEIIVGMIPSLEESLMDKGIFIASGIILEKISLVENKLKSCGLTILEVEEKGEWAVVIAKKEKIDA